MVANLQTGDQVYYDRIVLRNLLVLKAPSQDTKSGTISSTQKYSVTLAVTDSQSSKLLYVVKNAAQDNAQDGGWALELRPVVNAADSPDNVESIRTVLLDGLSTGAQARVLGGKP